MNSAFQAVGLALGVFDRIVEKSARKQQYEHEQKMKEFDRMIETRKQQYEHEQKMKELEMISHSNLRDQYVYEMFIDNFGVPIKKAQNKIQDAERYAKTY